MMQVVKLFVFTGRLLICAQRNAFNHVDPRPICSKLGERLLDLVVTDWDE